MRLWSRGLGRLVLPLELGRARLDLTPDHVVLSGMIREGKVAWDYVVKLDGDDLIGFARVARTRIVLDFLAREHGLRLLGTIYRGGLGFLRGLVRTAFGRGEPVVGEETLEIGPRAARRGARRRRGILVKRAR